MSNANAKVGLMAGLLLLGACNRGAAPPAAPSDAVSATPAAAPASAPAAPTINASMTQVMAVQAQTIWDTASKAFNDRGDGLEASKLTADDWSKVGDAAKAMKERALYLANTPHIVVAVPGETIMGAEAVGKPAPIGHAWDAASAAQIQAKIDANPALFSQHAKALADAMDSLATASQIKDVKTFYKVSSGLDDLCDGCHKPVWGTDEPPPFPKKAGG